MELTFFLAQYTKEVSNLHKVESADTLGLIIWHLFDKKYYKKVTRAIALPKGGQTEKENNEIKIHHKQVLNMTLSSSMLEKYQTYISRDENKKYTGEMHNIYKFMQENYQLNQYFSRDEETTRRVKEHSFTVKKDLSTPVETIESALEQMTKTMILLQNNICRENRCLDEEDRKKVCEAQRFDTFDRYFNPKSPESIYEKLNENCQKNINMYFTLSITSTNNTVEDFGESVYDNLSNQTESESTTEKKDDELYDMKNSTISDSSLNNILYINESNIDLRICLLKKLYKECEDIEVYYSSKAIEKSLEVLFEDIVRKFLQSQTILRSDIYFLIKVRPYNQILFLYMESILGSINNSQNADIKESKEYIRSVMFLLSKDNNDKNAPKTILGESIYDAWVKRFFLIMKANKIVEWIGKKSEYTDSNWIELKNKLYNPLMQNNYNLCKEYLPKDIRLEQSKAKQHIETYIKSIVDIYEIKKDKNIIASVDELIQLKGQKGNHLLFKTFLAKEALRLTKGYYLEKVVVDPNREEYLYVR